MPNSNVRAEASQLWLAGEGITFICDCLEISKGVLAGWAHRDRAMFPMRGKQRDPGKPWTIAELRLASSLWNRGRSTPEIEEAFARHGYARSLRAIQSKVHEYPDMFEKRPTSCNPDAIRRRWNRKRAPVDASDVTHRAWRKAGIYEEMMNDAQ